MELTTEYFIPVITEEGVDELYSFVNSILYKNNMGIDSGDYDDLRHEMIVACLTYLPIYDPEKCPKLGGYLYWPCRGAISKWRNKRKRCVPMLTPLLEKIGRHGL